MSELEEGNKGSVQIIVTLVEISNCRVVALTANIYGIRLLFPLAMNICVHLSVPQGKEKKELAPLYSCW